MLVPKDKRVVVLRTPDSLNFSWKFDWTSPIPTFIFGLFLLAGACFIPFLPNEVGDPQSRAMQILVATMCGLPGLGAIYYGFLQIYNRCRILADRDRLVFTCGPLPCMRNREFAASDLVQFYASGTPVQVFLLDQEHFSHQLVTRLHTQTAAFQLVHELHEFYGFEDVPVYGETTFKRPS